MTLNDIRPMKLGDGTYIYGNVAELYRAGHDVIDVEAECWVRVPVDLLEGGEVSLHAAVRQMFKPEYRHCLVDEQDVGNGYAKAPANEQGSFA